MRRAWRIPAFALPILVAVLLPALALAEFDPSPYKETTQTELAKSPESKVGKKFKISDTFNFCGSDFCAQFLKTKINTREYYCFNLGTVCLVRMYLKKSHPEAELLSTARKGDRITVYGTFDHAGSNYNYLVADHIVVEKRP